MERMDREEFFGKLADLDERALRKALWNLYWRGAAPMRERIEREINPGRRDNLKGMSKEPIDPMLVLDQVRDFAQLARSGAYMGGDRRVTPRERSRWRFTFQRIAADVESAVREDCGANAVAAAVELVELVREMGTYDYFHSGDPVEAARFVVSDLVAVLWERTRDQHGFQAFAEQAAPQLVRWECRYGWTRCGFGKVSERETPLATILMRMLRPDAWVDFTDSYLDALDAVSRGDAVKSNRGWGRSPREQRSDDLAEWHGLLLDRLAGNDGADRLERLIRHPALAGPELWLLQARLAHKRGDDEAALRLAQEALRKLPGHRGLLDFTEEMSVAVRAHDGHETQD